MDHLEKTGLSDFKNLLIENKKLDGLKEFIRDYISEILEGKKLTEISKNDFLILEGYIENLNEYMLILDQNNVNILDVSILARLIQGIEINTFKDKVKNKRLVATLQVADSGVIKQLFEIDGFSLESLVTLMEDDDVFYLIKNLSGGIFSLLFKLDGFILKDLAKIAKNEDIINFLLYVKKGNFSRLCKIQGFSLKNLEAISMNKQLYYLLLYSQEWNFSSLCKLDGISLSNLEVISMNDRSVYLLQYSKKGNFSEFLRLGNISTVEEFINVSSNLQYPTLEFLCHLNTKKISKLNELFLVNNIDDFNSMMLKLKEKKHIFNGLQDNIFLKLLKYYNVENDSDFIEFINDLFVDKIFYLFLKSLTEENFNDLIELYNIKSLKELKDIFKELLIDNNNFVLFKKMGKEKILILLQLDDLLKGNLGIEKLYKLLLINDKLIDLLRCIDKGVLIEIIDLFKIRNINDFDKIIINDKLIYFFHLIDHKNFTNILKLKNFDINFLVKIVEDSEFITFFERLPSKFLNKLLNNKNIKTINDLFDNKKLFIQNIYIEDEKNLLEGKYIKQNNDMFDFYNKYKNNIDKDNEYLGDSEKLPYNRPFSIINKHYNKHLTGEHVREFTYKIGNQKFFDVNKKKDNITRDVQLEINRLFSPFFPMTRLLKLINGNENYVSIDVENSDDGIDLCKLNNGISEEINKFFILIYQFLTIDYDRTANHNLGKEYIIYDFDYMFDYTRNLYFFDGIFNNEKNFKEMGDILYILKDYLINEVDELLEYYNKENKNDVVKIFTKLRTRLDMLNFSNLIYYNNLTNLKIKKFAIEIDNKHYK